MLLSCSQFVNSIDISQSDIETFQKKGFLKIKQILRPEAISALKDMTLAQLKPTAGHYPSSEIAKMKYELDGSIIKEIYSSREFNIINELAQKQLLFLQGIGLQNAVGKIGFPWHVGTVSFGYLMPQDYACTLWVPLDRISINEQHGGMTYVPEDVASARGYFSLIDSVVREDDFIEGVRLGKFEHFYNAPELEALFCEKNRVEHDFELGDALLFNKFVWHRSCILKPGPMKCRTALLMRFCEKNARYGETFLKRFNLAMEQINFDTNSNFADNFAHLKEGDLISNWQANYVGQMS